MLTTRILPVLLVAVLVVVALGYMPVQSEPVLI